MFWEYQKAKIAMRFCRKLCKRFLTTLNRQIIWLLRSIFGITRRQKSANAGFVLPTVVLVSLVVVLLTSAILFRAFDRSKNASNVRVNEIVIKAAQPAIDRAKAKIIQLFNDPRLPRSTPSDSALTQVIEGNISSYTFGDETQLQLYYNVDGTGAASSNNNLNTAWKYPVDTDNNGKYDSFTLYGIYFRTPSTTRPRTPIEARAQPMNEGISSSLCANALTTSATLVSSQGWYKVGSKLKRSVFVYTITVPITDITTPGLSTTKFETYNGNRGFSSLEYQQDRERNPLTNSAVIYDNDLEISPGTTLNLNGRVATNGNLIVVPNQTGGGLVQFYLVSSASSCYYSEDNSRIVVGGNLLNSLITPSITNNNKASADLFQDYGGTATTPTNVDIHTYVTANSVSSSSAATGVNGSSNDYAYSLRINKLVADAMTAYSPTSTSLPQEVQTGIQNELYSTYGVTTSTATTSQLNQAEKDQLIIYFQKSTRRVPYTEVPYGTAAATIIKLPSSATSSIQGCGDGTSSTNTACASNPNNPLRPIDNWSYPFDKSSGSGNTYSMGLAVNSSSNNLILPATDPAYLAAQTTIQENKIGDRILVGNNLPQYWLSNTTNNSSATSTTSLTNSESGISVGTGQDIYKSSTISSSNAYQWDLSSSTPNVRQRYSQADHLQDLGNTDRNQFWEISAAEEPANSLDTVGGLRVITGAGIYLPNDYIPSATVPRTFTNTQTVVWPDSMATGVTSLSAGLSYDNTNDNTTAQLAPHDKTPYLQMRATVVYHYLNSSYNLSSPQTYQQALACVSSFYDPTSSSTARNNSTSLPDVSPLQPLSFTSTTPNYVKWSNNALLRALQIPSGTTDYVPSGSSGNSNNGVAYPVPTLSSAGYISTTNYERELTYQASLRYPNANPINQPGSIIANTSGGRLVNPWLATAWSKVKPGGTGGTLTLAEQSAIDSAMCALKILDGSISPSDAKVPHGAIMETTFLDARQVKALDKSTSLATEMTSPSTSTPIYDLDVEFRQPLEIRATVLDLDLLRRQSPGGYSNTDGTTTTDYLLPNSGIIYATREDALSDNSSCQDPPDPIASPSSNTTCQYPNSQPNASNPLNAAANGSDYILDPTRRANAILLVNGSVLARGGATTYANTSGNTYIPAEKGLTLASNLPVYVQADTNASFNHHSHQEYTTLLSQPSWSNFYTRTSSQFDPSYACRAGQFSNCGQGETWRPATIVADAITVLSNNFQLGYRSDGDYNLRDNYGNYPIGYDFNGNGTIDPTTSLSSLIVNGAPYGKGLDEIALQFDVDGDGSISNTSVTSINESLVGVDINSNGVIDSSSNPVTITEGNITSTVAARLNGFWDNSFVTSRSFTDSLYSGTGSPSTTAANISSSYFTNGITPIQRRVTTSEYLMEICPKLVVTACNPTDWVVGYDLDHNGTFTSTEKALTENQLMQTVTAQIAPYNTFNKQYLWSGTTAQPAGYIESSSAQQQTDQLYPRRVAFLRYGNSITTSTVVRKSPPPSPSSPPYVGQALPNNLVLDTDHTPILIGLSGSSGGQIKYYPLSNSFNITTNGTTTTYPVYSSINMPNDTANSLWFRTSCSGTSCSSGYNTSIASYGYNFPLWIQNYTDLDGILPAEQPLLIPVLQIQYSTKTPAAGDTTYSVTTDHGADNGIKGNWFQVATATEVNTVFAQGDAPGRPPTTTPKTYGESGGGLENFVRFLENWNNQNLNIAGSFIQFKRSSFATGAFQTFVNSTNSYSNPTTTSIFAYGQGYHDNTNNSGDAAYYNPPNRLWGYDVALLTQLPDLFSERLTTASTTPPNEFYRETSRDDKWVQSLLCGAQNFQGGYDAASSTYYSSTGYTYAISPDQRGTCTYP